MIGVGVAGAYMCAPVCVSVYIITRFSTQSCQPHFISFTESLQWDLGVLSPSRVHCICWDKTLSKASLKRVWIFTEEKKRRERCKYIWGGFFFSFFLGSICNWEQQSPPLSLWPCSAWPVCTYTASENGPAPCFLGKEGLWGCGLFEVGGGSADIRGMRSNPSKLGF